MSQNNTIDVAKKALYEAVNQLIAENPQLTQKRRILAQMSANTGVPQDALALFERCLLAPHPRAKLLYQDTAA